ncbi:mechanosensitive ion channel family protein [Holophaga foetida]|uniref:mechanosensitive ion channel family protein n=1 Tax=Holophaga foetida TaxID=35839 RepID=UPI000247502F|nr:mechanosensitive ion channel family protein [Holophaga foetida]
MQTIAGMLRASIAPVTVTLATWVFLWVARRVLTSRITAFAKRTETEIDDLLAEVLQNTKTFSMVATSIYIGSRWLPLTDRLDAIAYKIFVLMILIQGILWANRAIGFVFGRMLEKSVEANPANRTSIRALTFASRVVAWTIFLLLGLDNLGVNITGLVAGLGVGGIAVALAVQNVLGDLFASLSIVLDKPVEVGDFIIVDEFLGTVDHIGLKTTRIRSLSGEQIIFSNSDLLKSRIRNYKRMNERRVLFTIGVTYQTSHDKLTRIVGIIKDVIEEQGGTKFDRAHFSKFGDFSLHFEVVYYLSDPDYNIYMDTQQCINIGIYKAFATEEIEFAYPTQVLYISKLQTKICR